MMAIHFMDIHLKKAGLELMFWSGQDFMSNTLRQVGSFKAAVINFKADEKLPVELIEKLVETAKMTQYDYKNIVKNKGVLNRLK